MTLPDEKEIHGLVAVSVIVLALSIVSCAARLWSRMRSGARLWVDDYLAFASFVCEVIPESALNSPLTFHPALHNCPLVFISIWIAQRLKAQWQSAHPSTAGSDRGTP